MTTELQVAIGQYSDAGPRPINQDFHGAAVPTGAALRCKGIALALADGIGSSEVSHIASAAAVRGFLDDYYATSQAWTVRRAAQRVIAATNSWLHAQTLQGPGRHDRDHGHVCTFSALVFKGREAHLLHVGDTRVYRVHHGALEPLTVDHRVRLGPGETYLGRALGIAAHVEIDYDCWPTAPGETYLLATDGAWEHLDAAAVQACLHRHGNDLQACARAMVMHALAQGGDDNATVQLARVMALPEAPAPVPHTDRAGWEVAAPLSPGQQFEGCTVLRELHASARSHVYLVRDNDSGHTLVLKLPATAMREDPAGLDRFVLEEWAARRIDSPHVIRAAPWDRPRAHLFVALEPVQGRTLAQWMTDHPRPEIDPVRRVVEQAARGLQALHRRQMLHQDLRPENLMIDDAGTVTLIDLAAVHVAGLAEGSTEPAPLQIVGALQYTAPEYFTGQGGSAASDLWALAALTYQMLAGQLPYGLQVPRLRQPRDLYRLHYTPLRAHRPDLPAWLDAVLRQALHPQPRQRQAALSEFVHELRHPGTHHQRTGPAPLIERHPVAFWRTLALLASLSTLLLLVSRWAGR
ncbi:MAG: bifunctional protein-serine/threonine kinase/phosphatase [Burkholderiaceae bacterium]|nr:bifunctional protein-serine/threonine kinase/phosphatase [Aquabacterium sp.]NUP87185.1 bifunctional protein-serine/threonine kinase/phosphatase [Burkholderiaceae bacterium]